VIYIQPDVGHVGKNVMPYNGIVDLWAKFGAIWRIWTKQTLYCPNIPDYRAACSKMYFNIAALSSLGQTHVLK